MYLSPSSIRVRVFRLAGTSLVRQHWKRAYSSKGNRGRKLLADEVERLTTVHGDTEGARNTNVKQQEQTPMYGQCLSNSSSDDAPTSRVRLLLLL